MRFADFFSHGQSPAQLAIFVAVFLLCWNLERFFGVTTNYRRWRHDRTNFWFVLPGGLMQLALGLVFVRGLVYVNGHGLGLLERWGVTGAAGQIAASFVVWDFFYYVYHVVMHKVKPVWRFHAVHHSDPVMNVSTSLREHPGETFIRLAHYMLVSWALGPAMWVVTLHQFTQIVSKIIIHSNWRLPEAIDRRLSLVLLTPNMHHVHHHFQEPYTDSNYGDLFSIWDRMFGTYRHLLAHEVRFGLDVLPPESSDLRFGNLMKLPFDPKLLLSAGHDWDVEQDDELSADHAPAVARRS